MTLECLVLLGPANDLLADTLYARIACRLTIRTRIGGSAGNLGCSTRVVGIMDPEDNKYNWPHAVVMLVDVALSRCCRGPVAFLSGPPGNQRVKNLFGKRTDREILARQHRRQHFANFALLGALS